MALVLPGFNDTDLHMQLMYGKRFEANLAHFISESTSSAKGSGEQRSSLIETHSSTSWPSFIPFGYSFGYCSLIKSLCNWIIGKGSTSLYKVLLVTVFPTEALECRGGAFSTLNEFLLVDWTSRPTVTLGFFFCTRLHCGELGIVELFYVRD